MTEKKDAQVKSSKELPRPVLAGEGPGALARARADKPPRARTRRDILLSFAAIARDLGIAGTAEILSNAILEFDDKEIVAWVKAQHVEVEALCLVVRRAGCGEGEQRLLAAKALLAVLITRLQLAGEGGA